MAVWAFHSAPFLIRTYFTGHHSSRWPIDNTDVCVCRRRCHIPCLCLHHWLIQTCDPSFGDATQQSVRAILTPPHCVCQSLTHKHQLTLSEEEQHQCKVALLFCRRSSADWGESMMDRTKRVHLSPSQQSKWVKISDFLTLLTVMMHLFYFIFCYFN